MATPTQTQKLQALLYAHGGEMKKSEIASYMKTDVATLARYTVDLAESLTTQGLELLETETTLSLRTAAVCSEFITQTQQHDSTKDIGTAGLEVLAIVLYKEGASRATIDYIRGVNSSGTLRQLVLRGLLTRTRDTNDARAWIYAPTPELLTHIGTSSSEELPEYETIASALNENTVSQTEEHESH